jgi:hypothetical protein
MADDKKKKNIFSRIVAWFKEAAQWVVDKLTDDAIAQSITEDLGLKPGQKIPEAKKGQFVQFASGLDPEKEALSDSIAEITEVAQAIKALAATYATDDFPAGQLSYTILKLAATDSVRLRLPWLFALSRTVLFFEEDTEALIMLDPSRLLRNLRGEDLPSGELLAQRLAAAGALVLQLLDAFTSEEPDAEKPGHVDIFSGWDLSPESVTPLADLASLRTTTFHISQASQTGAGLLASIVMVPTEHGGPGLFISLGGNLTIEHDTDTTKFRFDAGMPNAFDLFVPIGDSKIPFTVQGGETNPFLKFTISAGQANEPAFRLGEPDGTRLDIYQMDFGIDIWKQNAGFHAGLRDAELVIAPGPGDSFLRTIAGDGAKLKFSIGLIGDTDGFRLDGGSNARATLPVGRSLAGLLTVHHLEIGLGPSSNGGDFGLELSGGFTANLGPFSAVVDRLGFQLDFDRRDDGNFGPFNLGLGFKPPNGIGLRLDAGFAKGGGYLFADPANNEYAGALELQLGKFSLKAIGVLTTRPNDWSLLLLIYGQFPPIQIYAGFTLNGVGGMIGVQHGIDIVQLSAGMKTKAFDDILFPDNPVADAPRIINRLRTLFPISPRSLTIGPMVDIGWGSPRFVFIRIAVLFQVDDVFHSPPGAFSLARIVLLGELKVLLGPTKDDPNITVVRLIVDVLGFWDFDKKKYGFLAALRDSKIVTINITGGLGVFGEYGDHPRFILAAGGFNPRFKDVPAEMGGAIERLGAAFKVGRFSLKLTGYFALTPGTIQAGLDLAATAKIGPVGLKGELGFDVIIYREPDTHFIADFRIIAEISYKGHTLAGVKVVGVIEGPGLWHLTGKVTFSILFWDIDKSFDETWGSAQPVLAVLTNVQALLATELARRDNWTTQLPAGDESMVTFAPPSGDVTPLGHPLGRLAFSQTVVPLGLTLEQFGDGGITGPNRFDLAALTVGGQVITQRAALREHFARAQFIKMTDDEKLTRASFEEMDAGVEFSSATFHVSANALTTDMEYETAYLDVSPRQQNSTRPDLRLGRVALDHDLIRSLAAHGAAARAPQRADERMSARIQSKIVVTTPPLAVADRTAFAVDPTVAMTGQAHTVEMIAEQRFRPNDATRSQLVEEFELAGV